MSIVLIGSHLVRYLKQIYTRIWVILQEGGEIVEGV